MSLVFGSLRALIAKTRGLFAALFLVIFVFILLPVSSAQLPISTGAPYTGQKAPAFALPDQHGKVVSLADLLKPPPGGKQPAGVALIFYRGFW